MSLAASILILIIIGLGLYRFKRAKGLYAKLKAGAEFVVLAIIASGVYLIDRFVPYILPQLLIILAIAIGLVILATVVGGRGVRYGRS